MSSTEHLRVQAADRARALLDGDGLDEAQQAELLHAAHAAAYLAGPPGAADERLVGEAYLAVGDPRAAALHARRALALAAADAPADRIESELLCAQALEMAGAPGGARRHLVEARRLLATLPAGDERDRIAVRVDAVEL
jgi:hypothetical protein